MKYQFSFRIVFIIIFNITFVFTTRLDAQSVADMRSSLSWDFGFGSGSYNGFVSHDTGSAIVTGPGRDNFNKLATTFRLLLATDLLNSRLSLGFEYGLQMIREGGPTILLNVNAPDAMIHSIAHIETRYYNPLLPSEHHDESTFQVAASGGVIMPIRVSSSVTIDPEIRTMVSAGKEKLFLVQFVVGLSYRW